MELIKVTTKTGIELRATYQRQGNDKNGNPIYIINIFQKSGYKIFYNNITYFVAERNNIKLDKYGNIRLSSYDIDGTIQNIIDQL